MCMHKYVHVSNILQITAITYKEPGAGPTRYPRDRVDKAMDRRACQLLGEYRRKVANVDREYYGTGPGEVGPDSSSWLGEGDY